MGGILKAFNLFMGFVNKLMGNLQRAEDKRAGAEEVKSKQYEERLAKIKAADRIRARPDRDRLRRDARNDSG